jgi:hypothetical protein
MATDDAATSGNQSFMERLISRMEVFGLNAARLILAATITIAVFAFVLGLIGLVIEGISYERKTNPVKYLISSITFMPHFSNVLANGRAQMDPDKAVTVDRVAGAKKDRDGLVSDRLAAMREAGVCIGNTDQCHDLDFQRKALIAAFGGNPATRAPEGSPVAFANALSVIDLSPYYGEYGFSNTQGATNAEWDAVDSCLASYKEKNGNLYVSKTPILFFGLLAQCHYDYRTALLSKLSAAPPDWSLEDTLEATALKVGVIACGLTIILIALTIIFFRLEVSFRALRNLDRLK